MTDEQEHRHVPADYEVDGREPPSVLRKCIARIVAPFMEGGREFDQMPQDRLALRKWRREGMCSTNDATQNDADELARAVLAAVTPQIEAAAYERGRQDEKLDGANARLKAGKTISTSNALGPAEVVKDKP